MAPQRSRFLVWGAGGHGKVVADLVRACGHDLIGFVDVDPAKRGEVVEPGGARVVMDERELLACVQELGHVNGVDAIALGIGDNRTRARRLSSLGSACVPPLVHPSAVVSSSATIGRGSVVFATAVVNAGARIGDAVIVNSAAVVEHDCVVGDGAHVSPNATLAGGVKVGERTLVGIAAAVIPNVVIGAEAIVGAGAVVIRDVAARSTVVGVPAAPLRRG